MGYMNQQIDPVALDEFFSLKGDYFFEIKEKVEQAVVRNLVNEYMNQQIDPVTLDEFFSLNRDYFFEIKEKVEQAVEEALHGVRDFDVGIQMCIRRFDSVHKWMSINIDPEKLKLQYTEENFGELLQHFKKHSSFSVELYKNVKLSIVGQTVVETNTNASQFRQNFSLEEYRKCLKLLKKFRMIDEMMKNKHGFGYSSRLKEVEDNDVKIYAANIKNLDMPKLEEMFYNDMLITKMKQMENFKDTSEEKWKEMYHI